MKIKKRKKIKISIKIIIILLVFSFVFTYFKFDKNFEEINKNDVQDVHIKDDDFKVDDESIPKTGNPIIDSLIDLSSKDKRIKKIIAEKENYPEELLDLLSRNIDMVDYVLNYNTKKGHIYSNNIGKVEKGKFPLLLQYDERWGYGLYGGEVLSINGCGPTAVAMVIAGLTGNNNITPYDVAKYSEENGYYTSCGTSWSFMTTGIKNFGIVGKELPLNKNVIISELNQGHPVICSMRPGDFTTKGHFILIVGIKDEMFIINDPNSKERSSKLWSYERISPQIKNLWAFNLN